MSLGHNPSICAFFVRCGLGMTLLLGRPLGALQPNTTVVFAVAEGSLCGWGCCPRMGARGLATPLSIFALGCWCLGGYRSGRFVSCNAPSFFL